MKKKDDVSLLWPHKNCIFEFRQESPDKEPEKIFYDKEKDSEEINKLLAPKVFTNFKRIDKDGEHPAEEIKPTDNLIIKGENLVAMHTLKERYGGKVKMIYIDPPYNTGSKEFKYHDRFSRSEWLTFMKNRLEVARELLKDDGVIFVQCDDREYAYLKVLMDEIFSEKQFISSIAVKVKPPSGLAAGSKLIFDVKENILIYGKEKKVVPYDNLIEKEIDKNSKTIKQYTMMLEDEGVECETVGFIEKRNDNIEIKRHKNYKITRIPIGKIKDINDFYLKNVKKIIRTSSFLGGVQNKTFKKIPDDELYSFCYTPSNGGRKGKKTKFYIYKKEMVNFLKDRAIIKNVNGKNKIFKTEHLSNFLDNEWWTGIAKEGGVKLNNGKKPEELLRILIALVTKEGDLVMDFFAGTGTTCAVAHKMNRQYIGIEILDYGENGPVARLKNVINGDKTGISKKVGWKGGGSFVYCELLKRNGKYINRNEATAEERKKDLLCSEVS